MNRNPATGQELKTAGKIVAQGAARHVRDAREQSAIGTGGTQLLACREHGSRCSNILAFDLVTHADHVGARTGKSDGRGVRSRPDGFERYIACDTIRSRQP